MTNNCVSDGRDVRVHTEDVRSIQSGARLRTGAKQVGTVPFRGESGWTAQDSSAIAGLPQVLAQPIPGDPEGRTYA